MMAEFKLTVGEVIKRYHGVLHKLAMAQREFHEAMGEFHRDNQHSLKPETKHRFERRIARYIDDLKDIRNEMERIT